MQILLAHCVQIVHSPLMQHESTITKASAATTAQHYDVLEGAVTTKGISVHSCGSSELAVRVIKELHPKQDVELAEEPGRYATDVQIHHSSIIGGEYWSGVTTLVVRDRKTQRVIGKIENVRIMSPRIPA